MNDTDVREDALYQRLRELGIESQTYRHAAVFTVEEASAVSDHLPGGHTKNLFLKDKKSGLWLVVVDAARRVDLNALAKALGSPRFSFGSAEMMVTVLGVTPGSVTPFALMNDTSQRVCVVLDQEMLKQTPLNFHPLRNDRTTAIAAEDLLSFVRACGHEPIIAAIPQRAGD